MYSAAYAWAKAVSCLEGQFGPIVASTWLDDAELIELKDDRLIIYSPSDFRQESIRRKCKGYIEEALKDLFKREIELVVWGEAQLKEYRTEKATRPVWVCNPQFSFDNYIAGSSNPVPLRSAMHVAENPSNNIYNPLYFYGAPGVGKTHLLCAIANDIAQRYPDKRIVYVKGEQFTNELVQSILVSNTLAFKKKYRQADILLVDDIQFIAGKEATQDEFFHTFNHLYDQGKQIVLASDRRPSDMPTLEDRLKSRFGVGVMVEITPPDTDTRALIVRDKAKKLGLALDDTSVRLLSEKLCDNVRQIEGGLRKIRAYRDLSGMVLTPENISRTVEDMQSCEACSVITADTVVRYVCRYYGVDAQQLKSQLRSKNIAEPRQVAMYLIRHLTKMSFPHIGQFFERDSATVQHAVRKIDTAIRNGDRHLESNLKEIQANIESNA